MFGPLYINEYILNRIKNVYIGFDDNVEVKLNQISDYDINYSYWNENIINLSKTVFINGTVGLYEDERFKMGTVSLLTILKDSTAKTFVGGGDAVSATNKLGFENDLYYKSTGGGATLEYIIEKKMIALED